VTVLFARVIGLQTLSEQLDLEDARALTRSCLNYLFDPVYKYDGTLDKFFRQMVMVLFGAPRVHEDDAERALRAALEMSQALEQFNLEAAGQLPKPLDLSCGINTGLVFAGGVGAVGKETYSVVGDPVNLAHRLAHLADPGQVLVGENTYRQTRHRFQFASLPAIQVRGKKEVVQVYPLTGIQYQAAPDDNVAAIPPLVGRQEEIKRFRNRLHRLRNGEGGVVFIEGPAGVGKSRLVAEVRDVERDLRWMEGHSFSYSTNWPLTPFKDLFRRWFEVGQDSGTAVAQRVRSTLEKLLPESVDQLYPVVLNLLDIQTDAPAVQSLALLSAEGVWTRTLAVVRELLTALAESTPTVVVMEDSHWSDQSSIDMLGRILPLTLEVPLLFVIVARPEQSVALSWPSLQDSPQRVSRFTLSPLSPEETTVLIVSMLESSSVPKALWTYIRDKVEGNPLFIREVIHALIEEEALVKKDDRWQLTQMANQLEIPLSLQGLLTSRIDRLPAPVKRTLGYAAVVGREFDRQILLEIVKEEVLDAHLDILCRSHFIHRTSHQVGKEVYAFDHCLVQEIAYKEMLIEHRVTIHRRVLETLERMYAGHLDEHCTSLAYHAYAGQAWDKAIDYLHTAGDRAKGTWALPEAVLYYRQTMDAIQQVDTQIDRDRLVDLYHECSTAHTMLGEYDAARGVYQELLEMGQTRDDPYLRGHALQSASVVCAHTGDISSQVNYALAACQDLALAGADWSRGVALLTLAQGQLKSGDLDAAQDSIDEGLRLVGDERRWPGYDPRGEASHYAGLVALLKGDLPGALSTFEQSQHLSAQAGEMIFVGMSQCFAGLAHAYGGDYDAALAQMNQAIELGEENHLPWVVSLSRAGAAWAQAMAGRYGTAFRLTDFVATKPQAEYRDTYAIALLARGDAYLGWGDPERALASYQRSFETGGLSHVVTVSAMRGIGMAFLRLNQAAQGMASLSNAVAIATFGGLRWFRAQALRDLAQALLETGERDVALERIEELIEMSEPARYPPMTGWGHLLRGRATNNEADIQRAMDIGQTLGCLPLIWQAGLALGPGNPPEAAMSAVQTIAADLPEDVREDFLVRTLNNRRNALCA
jgi:class 3 adenylate cyclase/tetratricopeptide (TPR) repeat protein